MEKLTLLYDALEKLNDMDGIKCKVNFQVEYGSIEVNREVSVALDTLTGKNNNIKLNSKKLDYALAVIDIVNRINILEEKGGYSLILDIRNLRELKPSTCDIIKENIEDNKNNKGFKLPHIPKGISSVDLLKIRNDLKKLGVEAEDLDVKSVKIKAAFDRKMNLHTINLEGVSENIKNRKPLKITINSNI